MTPETPAVPVAAPVPETCARCGRTKAAHHVVNYADPLAPTQYLLLCPSATFLLDTFQQDLEDA